jgi:hypothetical protein
VEIIARRTTHRKNLSIRTSGIPFTRGPLAHLLRNRFYIGEVTFKGEILKGEQPAIPDRDLFGAVQTKLSEQATNHKATRMKPEALLAGRISDDRGNRMSPPYARKRGIKYRYGLPSALMQRAGSWLASRPHIKSQLKQMASFILLGRPKFIAVVFRRLGTSVTAAPLPI